MKNQTDIILPDPLYNYIEETVSPITQMRHVIVVKNDKSFPALLLQTSAESFYLFNKQTHTDLEVA